MSFWIEICFCNIFIYFVAYISPLDFIHSEILGSCVVILGYISEQSGLIAIEGSTGKERWKLALHSTPTSSICNVIDANADGYPECIIIGNNGLLTAVDMKKGLIILLHLFRFYFRKLLCAFEK